MHEAPSTLWRLLRTLFNERFDEPVDWHKREVRLCAMTRVLARRHRKRIECVAEALLAKEHLTAKQVDKLAGRSVDDVEPNIPGWEVPI